MPATPKEEELRIDREEATRSADRGGLLPRLSVSNTAIFTAIGVYFLLELFSATTQNNWHSGSWPVIGFTLALAAAVAAIQRWREHAWRKRYEEHLRHRASLRERQVDR